MKSIINYSTELLNFNCVISISIVSWQNHKTICDTSLKEWTFQLNLVLSDYFWVYNKNKKP